MRRSAVLVMCISVGRPAAAQQPVPPYRATWWDAVSVTAAGGLALLPGALDLPRNVGGCAPCNPAALPGIDRWVVGATSSTAATASNVLLVGVVGAAGFAALQGLASDQQRGNAAVLLNALGWTGAATEWLKVVVRRERPVMYTSEALAAASDRENRRSFPSGHASVAFAAATSYLVLAEREHLHHATRNALLLYAGAAGVASLRVAGGRHFPTDVAAGALLGSGIGWLIATVHPRAY